MPETPILAPKKPLISECRRASSASPSRLALITGVGPPLWATRAIPDGGRYIHEEKISVFESGRTTRASNISRAGQYTGLRARSQLGASEECCQETGIEA